MKMRASSKAITYIVSAFVIVACLFPFFWMLSTSLRPAAEIVTNPPYLLPKNVTLHSYFYTLFETDNPWLFTNSIIVSLLTTVICIVFSTLAAYALVSFRFRGKNFWAILILCCQMVPGVSILLPLLLLSEKLHLDNTLIGLALVYQILVIPFCTWMLRGFFASIPREIDEAARIDGCSPFRSLWRIVLPISGPGVFVTAMFSWMVAWEEFLFALTLTRDNSARTIPVGIDFFMGEHYIDWGPIMATSVLMSVPIIILFFFFQDKYIQGIAGGAVKG